LQRHVLCNQGLPLRDLAKLAPEGKVFEEACLELYEAELKWLEGTTISTFGGELIAAAARFLCCQDISPTGGAHYSDFHFDLRKGGAFPAYPERLSAGKDIIVDAPALGLLADGQTSDVHWRFMNQGSWQREAWERGVGVWVNQHCHLFSFKPRNIKYILQFRDSSKLIAFLGLQLLIWQKCEEGGQVGRGEGPTVKPPRHLLLTRNEASRLPEEAQRAYSVLHMWAWRTWCKNVW
jgi:hypothetical protein